MLCGEYAQAISQAAIAQSAVHEILSLVLALSSANFPKSRTSVKYNTQCVAWDARDGHGKWPRHGKHW